MLVRGPFIVLGLAAAGGEVLRPGNVVPLVIDSLLFPRHRGDSIHD